MQWHSISSKLPQTIPSLFYDAVLDEYALGYYDAKKKKVYLYDEKVKFDATHFTNLKPPMAFREGSSYDNRS